MAGKCNEWVDEFYPKIKHLLREAEQNNISINHIGWRITQAKDYNGPFASRLPGHEAVEIEVFDAPGSKPSNRFRFYLDDGYVGGNDHVFVAGEFVAKIPHFREVLNVRLQANLPLEEMKLSPPIGPGKPTPGNKMMMDGMSFDGRIIYHARP